MDPLVDGLIHWQSPPQALEPNPDEVHLWRIDLALSATQLSELERLLLPDERERADRFQFAPDRARFVAARAALRGLLGRYAGMAPQRIKFNYGPHGKPALCAETGAGDLRFNLAHSEQWALCAVAWKREVGVDIEKVRACVDFESIANRFFSFREVGKLRALPADARRGDFFVAWVRKEAYAKARGEGLGLLLNRFEVSLLPGEPAALLHAQWDQQESQRWTLFDLAVAADHKAALAVEGSRWTPRYFGWEWPSYSLL